MRRRTRALALAAVLGGGGCGGLPNYIAAPKRESVKDLDAPTECDAFCYLASPAGPPRFARVSEGVYRGGQPTRKDLEALRELGVRTVINLRREDRDAWRQEEANARELGMKFLHFPFYGVFGADDLFLQGIIEQMKQGNVYVHCKHGRDRTSLLISLYRVIVEDWEPKVAWKLEAVDYGSAQTYFYRQLRVVFDRMVRGYPRMIAGAAESASPG
jgi:protein tyrosine phosphatase (PTP) superfamily phosphohydrolase (DUF442 family)